MEVVCKNCPVGCHLVVKDGEVYGNKCARGLSYKNYEEKSVFLYTGKFSKFIKRTLECEVGQRTYGSGKRRVQGTFEKYNA